MDYQIRYFRDEWSFLSNFYDAPILYKGIKYKNSESAYQAQKCPERAGEFCGLSGQEAKALGKRVSLRSDWDDVKDEIMYEIVKAKFTQNPDLKNRLVLTKDFDIIEGNTWGDTYWGVDFKTNKGQNKLGEILMQVRAELLPRRVKIGITEQGDAGIDFSWCDAVKKHKVTGAVLITKNMTPKFIESVLEFHKTHKKLIAMVTCTGFGGSKLEPNVPPYKQQLNSLRQLVDAGFPIRQCVLRIDPIFPVSKGFQKVREVVEEASRLGLLQNIRVRISIYDEYTHVKKRLRDAGQKPLYGESFYASEAMMERAADVLSELHQQYNITFETCAETHLISVLKRKYGNDQKVCKIQGCVSPEDLAILDIPYTATEENMQGRSGCHCLACKTELLSNKCRCPNGCLYCYWK